MNGSLSQEEFLENLRTKNKYYENGYFEVISEYKSRFSPIFVKNKYGICKLTPHSLYDGGNITVKSSIDKTAYIIEKFKELHGDKYDYSKFEYVPRTIKSTIMCKQHGEFLSTVYAHLNNKRGCPKCSSGEGAILRTKKVEQFIKDSIKIHGDKFDYSLVDYKTALKKVEIICKKHGKFEQRANGHLSGKNGCKKCNEWINFKERWLNSKRKKGYLYLCKFYNDFEEFIKIGVTTTTIKERYQYQKYKNYNYDILEIIASDNKSIIWDAEEILKEKLKDFKFTPTLKFDGYSECYSIKNINNIYEQFERIRKGITT